MKYKNGKVSKILVIFFFLLVIVLSISLFLIYKIRDNNKNKDFIESIEAYIDNSELEILKKVYNADLKKGVYTYQIIQEGNEQTKELVFSSGDNRMLSLSGDSNYQIYDGKFLYNVSDEYKKFHKKELKDYTVPKMNQTYLDYGLFFYDTGKGKDYLIDGLTIKYDGNNYIIKNNEVSYIFNKDLIMTESTGKSAGKNNIQKLINIDEDFDKYYEEYFSKLDHYEEVEDLNMVSP